MSEKEESELEALQRELDDAFTTTRPRRGFEDELWLRLQARRPLWTRVRDGLVALLGGAREAPAIPLTALAVVLIIVVGAGILSLSLHPGGVSESALSQPAPQAGQALGPFGRLPSPALHPGLFDTALPGSVAYGPSAAAGGKASLANLYFGPAILTWTGTFAVALGEAPVFRYSEPSTAQADQFAASIGASNTQGGQAAGFLGTYSGQGFTLSVRGSVPQLPKEPFFLITLAAGAGPGANDPQAAASSVLARFGLVPAWPYTTSVQQSSAEVRVQFLREFQVPGAASPYLVDWNGGKYGIDVQLVGGRPVAADGPLPLHIDEVGYRLISNDQALSVALNSAPATNAAITPTPVVNLDTVEFVYALAIASGQGFYEPAYLFSGTFQYNDQTYTKRILVPLVDPSLRSA